MTLPYRRRRILRHLARVGPRGATSREVAADLNLSQGATSGALTALHRDGHITSLTQRRGTFHVYAHPDHADNEAPYRPRANPTITRVEEAVRTLRANATRATNLAEAAALPAAAEVVVAMAGNHPIWSFRPQDGTIRLLSGTMNEGLTDGDGESAWYAHSSGLDLAPDGRVLVADSETSAIRRLDPATGEVATLVGVGLFDFGFRDGPADQARLQHPLGVRSLPDGSIAIADTYNGAIRRFDPTTDEVTTLARGLREPSDILVIDAGATSGAEGSREAELLVVESAAHALTRVKLPKDAQKVDEGALTTKRPSTEIASGPVTIGVSFTVPAGQKLDDRWGDPTFLQVSATPPELLVSGDGGAEGLSRDIVINPDLDGGVLHLTARAAACDGEPGGEIPLHAACHLYQQDWGIPVELKDSAPRELHLDLQIGSASGRGSGS